MDNERKKVITGLHIVGQIRTNTDEKLKSESMFKSFLSEIIQGHQLQELGSYYFTFKGGGGFTGVVCLTESHIAIHTWPELQYVTLDVFLCNYSKNNEETCRSVFSDICEYFTPVSISKEEIIR